MIADLQPHPAHPPSTLTSLTARIERTASGFQITYDLGANLSALRIPAPAAPARTDELWKTTCFELFLRQPHGPGYFEFNFSPSTQWAAYSFTGRREGMAPLDIAAPAITRQQTAEGLTLTVQLDLPPSPPANSPLRAALTAIVEDATGARSFWAITHPAEAPDFHHPDGFALTLPTP